MRRSSLLSAAAMAAVASGLFIPSADAGTREMVTFTDHRIGPGPQSSVTTDLAECPTAEAVDLRSHVEFTRTHGVFVALRDFRCGDGTGFVVRLTANFSDGSVGSWSIVDAYGELEGLRGSGKLVGTSFGSETGDESDDGIDDVYTGWVTWAR